MSTEHLTVNGSIHIIQLQACQRCDVSMSSLLSRRRTKSLVTARHAAFLAARRLPIEPSYPDLGAAFNRDHTTVIHGIRKAKQRELADPWFAWLVHELEKLAEHPPAPRLRVAS